jgi:hypothetical protein
MKRVATIVFGLALLTLATGCYGGPFGSGYGPRASYPATGAYYPTAMAPVASAAACGCQY